MPQIRPLDRVVIRFAGDSGDGMQLTGDRFTSEAAAIGNDIATLPNFPAEIRAPQGTLAGVSSFQLQFADFDVVTAGDHPDVLVAMNPAALKANLDDLEPGAVIIVDTAEFTRRNLAKVGWSTSPLEDGSLTNFTVHALNLTGQASEAAKQFGLTRKDAGRTKNMYALGLLSWLYSRERTSTERFIESKFAAEPAIRDANLAAFRAGHAFGETTEAFEFRYEVAPAPMKAGTYRQITGNQATAYGLLTGAHLAGLDLFLGSYPITPASDILHELSRRKEMGVTCFQAEDEISAAGAALGASFAGQLGVSTTSGPGMTLKMETIGLAVMTELPLVVVDVQRAGPSTGLPTKTEQADLLQALYGRNGESPVPVLAPASASDCFTITIEACRLALTYRTPVIVLTDGYLANGAEPWLIPDLGELDPIDPGYLSEAPQEEYQPYRRDPNTLARAMAIPGTPGLEHRIGGLEKAHEAGTVSYDPDNHQKMVNLRAEKVARMARSIEPLGVDDPSGVAELLVLGWGSTQGTIRAAVRRLRLAGWHVATAQLRHLNPMPSNLDQVLQRYRRVVVPELNTGQLAALLRARFLVDVRSYSQVRGLPIASIDLEEELLRHLEEQS